MKKSICLILSLIIAFSCFSFCSSAISVNFNNAAISLSAKSVAFSGTNVNKPIFRTDLNAVFKEKDSYNYFSDGLFKRAVKITLSNGKTVSISGAEAKSVGDYKVSAKASISKADYEQAKADGKTSLLSVKISVTIKLVNPSNAYEAILIASNNNSKTQSFTLEKKAVSKYIKSISTNSKLPTKLYDGADDFKIDDAVFTVVYYDNTEKTIPISTTEDKNGKFSYDLNEIPLSVSFEGSNLVFRYLDSPKFTSAIELLENPYSAVKIIDYELTANGLQSLTYSIEKLDETSKTYHYNCSDKTSKSKPVPTEIINSVNGYNVKISSIDENKKLSATNEKLVICVSVAGFSSTIQPKRVVEQKEEQSVIEGFGRFMQFFSTVLDFFAQISSSIFGTA